MVLSTQISDAISKCSPNANFLELETLGPVVELQPEEVVEHVEHWWQFGNVPYGENDAWIDTAVVPLVKQTD